MSSFGDRERQRQATFRTISPTIDADYPFPKRTEAKPMQMTNRATWAKP